MAWTTPRTYTTGEVITAATLNTDHRDNLLDLDRRTKAVANTVLTSESTTSTTYAALATPGPAVTVSTGTSCFITLTAQIYNSGAGLAFMAFDISGATTVAASDVQSLTTRGTNELQLSVSYLVTGLTPGSNVFTAKYRVSANTGTFLRRSVIALPFGPA